MRTNRRTVLTALAVGLAGSAGCSTDGGGGGGGPSGLGSGEDASESGEQSPEADCRPGTKVTVATDSPAAVREAVDAPAGYALGGDEVQTVFFEGAGGGDAPEAIGAALQEAGFDVEAMASTRWCGEPVCEIGSELRFPDGPSEEAVEEAFPDAISIAPTASTRGAFWTVATPIDSWEAIRERLDDLSVEEGSAVVYRYDDCERFDD